jgi:hypothetical protein
MSKVDHFSDAMTPRAGEKAFWKCLICGERESADSFAAASKAAKKHEKATKHDSNIAMEMHGLKSRRKTR